jgi:hypothetical protein
MAISTNSIIHYTDSLDTIKSILKEGFRIKYCAEELKLGKKGESKAAHPMVSFCDIPLSDSKQHFDAYGKYGIGLSKQWAIKNGINPVIYIDKNSLIADSIYELIKERRKDDSNLTQKQKREILQIKSYAKNYSGPLKRRNVDTQNYKFYDEREWRLIPGKETINNEKFSVALKYYTKNKSKYNNKIENCRLTFEASDISYIIVEKTSEIHGIIKFLRNEFSEKCSANELDILFSKICSTEQIIADY